MQTHAPVQLLLDLPFEEAMDLQDFIVSSANAKAFDFITAWPDWAANVAVLSGPKGSGKSHLAEIWTKLTGARLYKGCDLTVDNIPRWLESQALVLEDISADRFDEDALFHLVNAVRNGPFSLLMTTDTPIYQWGLQKADTASRIRAAIPIEIESPDDVLMRQVFVKQFSDRQIMIKPMVIDYILNRIERSLSAVRIAVNRLDEAAFLTRRPITKHFAAEVLNL